MQPAMSRFLWLRSYYLFLVLLSVTSVMVIIFVGLVASFRPGVPTISHILEDNPSVTPAIYVIFVMFTGLSSTTAMLEWQFLKGRIVWYRVIATWIQILGLILIPVTSVDFMPSAHIVTMYMVVISTDIRELECALKKRPAFLLTQVISLLIFNACAITFTIWTTIVPFAERTSYVALLEHIVFLLVSALTVFNIVLL